MTQAKNKTIVAYRENGVDSIRGCRMGFSHSKLIIKTSNNDDDLVFTMMDVLESEEEHKGDYAYCRYDVYFIDSNGEQHYNYSAHHGEREWDSQEMNEIYNRAMIIHRSNVSAREAREAAAQAAEEKRKQAELEAREIARLKELAAKYPGVLNG